MKQKVVIKVQMGDEKKRRKAMKVAVGLPGVSSAAIEGAEKNQIVVIGDGVDSVALTTSLRKNMGFADLVSVAPVEEKKEAKNPEPTVQPLTVWPGYQPQYYCVPVAQDHHYQDPNCSIMWGSPHHHQIAERLRH